MGIVRGGRRSLSYGYSQRRALEEERLIDDRVVVEVDGVGDQKDGAVHVVVDRHVRDEVEGHFRQVEAASLLRLALSLRQECLGSAA